MTRARLLFAMSFRSYIYQMSSLLAGCRRTIYVCDDGKDRKKRRLCQRLGRDCIYVSGRTRAPNEMNGKSGNLNNCCRQIYPEGCTIPANEVICIMDADQVYVACPSLGFQGRPRLCGLCLSTLSSSCSVLAPGATEATGGGSMTCYGTAQAFFSEQDGFTADLT